MVSPGVPTVTSGFGKSVRGKRFPGFPRGIRHLPTLAVLVDSLQEANKHTPLKTIGPRSVSKPFDHLRYLDTLRTFPGRALQLGWIDDSSVADQYQARLDTARARLVRADSGRARLALEEVVSKANADSGEVLTPEGYALLYYNSRYLAGQLPRSPFPDIPAALTLEASGATAQIKGNAFAVEGRDVRGIATSTEAARSAVEQALKNNQTDNVTGSGGQEPDLTVAGPHSGWAALFQNWTEREDLQVLSGKMRGQETVGSASDPALAYAPDGLDMAGRPEGYGLLLVDGTLTMKGQAQWHGLVVVRNTNGTATLDLRGNPSIEGAATVLPAEGEEADLSIRGSAEIRYDEALLEQVKQVLLQTAGQ